MIHKHTITVVSGNGQVNTIQENSLMVEDRVGQVMVNSQAQMVTVKGPDQKVEAIYFRRGSTWGKVDCGRC